MEGELEGNLGRWRKQSGAKQGQEEVHRGSEGWILARSGRSLFCLQMLESDDL